MADNLTMITLYPPNPKALTPPPPPPPQYMQELDPPVTIIQVLETGGLFPAGIWDNGKMVSMVGKVTLNLLSDGTVRWVNLTMETSA